MSKPKPTPSNSLVSSLLHLLRSCSSDPPLVAGGSAALRSKLVRKGISMPMVTAMCGAEEERVVGTHKAPGACPCCGGAVVATDVESERRILCLPLCVKNKRKYSCTRCLRRLVTLYS